MAWLGRLINALYMSCAYGSSVLGAETALGAATPPFSWPGGIPRLSTSSLGLSFMRLWLPEGDETLRGDIAVTAVKLDRIGDPCGERPGLLPPNW
jgi:hypothetical protein